MGQLDKPDDSVTNPDHFSPDDSQVTPPPSRARNRRPLLTLGVALIVAVGLIIWASSTQSTHNGKPESYWLDSLTHPPPMSLSFTAIVNVTLLQQVEVDREEWQALGSQGVPLLINALKMQPGFTTKPYAKLWPRLPAPLQRMLPRPVNYRDLHLNAWDKLAHLAHRKTKMSIPSKLVTRALLDQDWEIRWNALYCLDVAILPEAGDEKDQFLPLLVRMAKDPQISVPTTLVGCLGHYHDQPNLVIPALSNALASPFPDVRLHAAMALNRNYPADVEKVRLEDVAYGCLGSNTHYGAEARQLLKELGALPRSP